jgi:hypothetical protein
MKSRKRQEEQSVLCSLSALTDFCLRDCLPGRAPSSVPDPCFLQCVQGVVEMRFASRDKWMWDYSATEQANNHTWKAFLQ